MLQLRVVMARVYRGLNINMLTHEICELTLFTAVNRLLMPFIIDLSRMSGHLIDTGA